MSASAAEPISQPPRVAPGPSPLETPGVMWRLRRDTVGGLLALRQKYGDLCRVHLGPRCVYSLARPDYIRYVLQDNHTNFTKQTQGYEKLRLALGNGLVTSEGRFWLRQRRIAQPAFHRERIAKFGRTMTTAAEEMVESWHGQEALAVDREMMRVTLRIVSRTLLSTEKAEQQEDAIGGGVADTLHYVADRARRLFNWPDFIPTPAQARFRRAVAMFDDLIYEAIAERRASPDQHDDLLAMLMEARDEDTGEGMDDKQLRDEAITMFGAGHETTANALSWTFYLLSKHPGIERRLAEEVDQVLSGRTPTIEDLPKLHLTENIIKESMRLYPPVFAVARSPAEDDTIGGYQVSKGGLIVISIYVMHRHPDYWTNPEGFDPDRFDSEEVANHPRFTYFPFLGGPRQCIGNTFAMMEAKLILATVAQRYRLALVPGHPVIPHPTVTLRPKHGLPMRLLPR